MKDEKIENPEKTSLNNDLEEAFNNIDKDKDGYINLSELGTVMRAFNFPLNTSELQEIMKKYDHDDSGYLDKTEFRDLMNNKIKEQRDEEKYLETFELFDRNGDGFLSKDELKTLFDSIGEDISEDLLDQFIKFTDTDGDGYINRAEFLNFMKEN